MTGIPAMSEKQLQGQVVKLARLTGHLVFHAYDARRSEPGFPDLFVVKATRLRPLLVELKTEKGKLTPAQMRWREALVACPGVDYRLWRPSDWPEIEAKLKGPRMAKARVSQGERPQCFGGCERRLADGEEWLWVAGPKSEYPMFCSWGCLARYAVRRFREEEA